MTTLDESHIKAAMKCIIQGTYGQLKYWMVRTSRVENNGYRWAGLIHQATEFESYQEAREFLDRVYVHPDFKTGIFPKYKPK